MQHSHTDLRDVLEQKRKIVRAGRPRWYHAAILMGSIALTLIAWQTVRVQVQADATTQYEREVNQTIERITERMRTYEDTLRSAAAFQLSQTSRTNIKLWRNYSQALHIERTYPGINGIGVIHNIKPQERELYNAYMRKDRPDFTIYPPHDQAELFPIAFIEPVEINAAAVGLDIAHEKNRFEAALKARNTGEPQITGPIILVQDQKKTPGFLFYLPYYKTVNLPDAKKRREEFAALVYAPFIMSKLVEGTYGNTERHIDIKITDGEQIMFDEIQSKPVTDSPGAFYSTHAVNMYGRVWTLDLRANSAFHNAVNTNTPAYILIGGLIINSLLLCIFYLLMRANRRAVKFASSLARKHETNAIQLSNIIENAPNGLIQLDENGNILTFNKACSQFFGYSVGEITGQSIRLLIPDMVELQKENTPKSIEFLGVQKDGSKFPIEFSATLLDLGEEQIFNGIIRDISEQKAAEAAIKESLKNLQLSNADLEKFAYIASHDLKSPLRAIDNLSAWISEDAEHLLDDTNKVRFSKLRGRVARMERLLDDLLQYSRAANKSYPHELVTAHSLVTDAIKVLNVPEGFKINIDDALKDFDVARMPLEQVFHNLIGNALKHNDKPTGVVTVTGKPMGDFYEFTVADDGPGIDPAYHDLIFEMFQTLRRRDEVEASGIGLALVKKIIQRFGGQINVKSVLDQGTAFSFTWRRVDKTQEAA